MNKFELFSLIFLYIDSCWEKSKDEDMRKYLSDANPFLFEDIGSAEPSCYISFCELINVNITVENSYDNAKAYIKWLNIPSVSAAFSKIDKERWCSAAREYLSVHHKGEI